MSSDRGMSRAELLKTIEEQKELIQRREQRLRDVVAAYKGVLKEKEALEKSVKALSQNKSKSILDVPNSRGPPSDAGSDRGKESDRESEDGNNVGKVFPDPLNVHGSEQVPNDSSTEVQELQTQIETLSTSLLTLTEEKSKLENNYIAEKKNLKQDIEELQKKCQELTDKLETQEQESSKSLLELRNRIRSQQIEREKEQTDHAVMLRELQKLLASERQSKESIEQQHDDAQFNMKEKDQLMKELNARHDLEVGNLKSQIKGLRDQLTQAQRKSEEPSPVVISLKKETEELKAQHQLLVQQDINRVKDANVIYSVFMYYSLICPDALFFLLDGFKLGESKNWPDRKNV